MTKNALSLPWYKEPWAWFVLTPLIVVVCVSTVFVSLAVIDADDVVVDNYYKEGRTINQSFEQDQRAVLWRIAADVVFDEKTQQITVNLTSDTPLPNTLSLWLDHPLDANLDSYVVLEQGKDQVYQATMPWTEGNWYLTLTPEKLNKELRSSAPWRLRATIRLPHLEKVLRLQPHTL